MRFTFAVALLALFLAYAAAAYSPPNAGGAIAAQKGIKVLEYSESAQSVAKSGTLANSF